jgi:multicomponent Na+:H+ antiporter subunit D
LLRLVYGVVGPALAPLDVPLGAILGWLAAGGIVAGSVMALAQSDLRRLLAYSSVAHVAMIALGLALGNADGLLGAMLHVVAHAVSKSCLFLVAGAVRQRGSVDGIGREMPWTSAALLLSALSMIGVPPTVGFFSKWYLLLGCLAAGRWAWAAVLLGSTWLSVWYFFRLIERAYFAPHHGVAQRREAPLGMLTPMLATAAATIVLGLASLPLARDVLRPALAVMAHTSHASFQATSPRGARR